MPTRKRKPPIVREKSLRRLPLGSLRVFVVAAEQLNFGRAGASLGMSTAAVSMHVRGLEEYLRVPLFQRNGRRVQLSAQGAAFLPRVRRALEDLETAIEALRADRHSGHLTVSMLASFLQQWLLPRLPDFHQRHPEIDLRLETSRTFVDFLHSDVQMAVRLGKGVWPNLHAEKLFDEWWVPVCAPALLAKHGYVEAAADLKRYRLLHSSSEPWESWPAGAARNAWARTGSTFDDSATVVRAAAAGQGLALARWSLVADEVAQKHLAIASSTLTKYEYSYYIVCPEVNRQIEKVARLSEWLHSQAKAFPSPHEFLKASRG